MADQPKTIREPGNATGIVDLREGVS